VIKIINGKILLANLIQSELSLAYFIDLSAKTIDKISIIILTILVTTTIFIND